MLGDHDRVAPATIGDLIAGRPIETTLLLAWTSVGDDGMAGEATTYEIRYATDDLAREDALDGASSLLLPTWPASGRHREILIGSLPRGRIVYFRVRAADEVSNWSAWSNLATAATENAPPEPRFTLWPDSLALGDTLHVDASGSTDLESGAAVDLRWDWNGNGVWDSDWSRVRTAAHAADRPGRYRVRLEARDEGGGTDVAESAIVVTGVRCLAQTTEAGARVRGDCCTGSMPCRRPCDYDNRVASTACGDVVLTRETHFTNGESRARQEVRAGLEGCRVVSNLTMLPDGTTCSADTRFALEFDVPAPTTYSIDVQLVPGSFAGTGSWSVQLRNATGEVASIQGDSVEAFRTSRSGISLPGRWALEVLAAASGAGSVEFRFDVLLGIASIAEAGSP